MYDGIVAKLCSLTKMESESHLRVHRVENLFWIQVNNFAAQAPTLQALLSLLSSDEGVEKLGALKATRSGRPLGAAVAATLRSLYFDTCLR